MPRKTMPILNGQSENSELLQDVYKDSFFVKNVAITILRNLSKTINYEDKTEVLNAIQIVEQQQRIILEANNKILEIEKRINEPQL